MERYLRAVERTEYPWSYHVLSGLFALGAVVGRRAAVKRSTYTLYPPISIMLMGESGTGKTEALYVAKRVLDSAAKRVPGFLVGDDTGASTSPRGWMKKWEKIQTDNESDVLEGVEFVQELSGFLSKRTGNENVAQWVIDALQHKEKFGDSTGHLGTSIVKGCTVGFGFATPVSTLREEVSIGTFEGGLMFRFLFAHEVDLDRRGDAPLDARVLQQLGADAVEIRDAQGPTMELSPEALDFLAVQKARSEVTRPPVKALGGFWRRYPGMICKIGNLIALSEQSGGIESDHLQRADSLLRGHLYMPLEAIVHQLAAGPKKRALLRAVDDLELAGPKGMDRQSFVGRFDLTSAAGQRDSIGALTEAGLIFLAQDGRIFATHIWKDEYEHRTEADRRRRANTEGSGREDLEYLFPDEEVGGSDHSHL
jgi:hypothetical protein